MMYAPYYPNMFQKTEKKDQSKSKKPAIPIPPQDNQRRHNQHHLSTSIEKPPPPIEKPPPPESNPFNSKSEVYLAENMKKNWKKNEYKKQSKILQLNKETILQLKRAIEAKFASCSTDYDLPIIVDSTLNTSTSLTLEKCRKEYELISRVESTTKKAESQVEELNQIANNICDSAKNALVEIKAMQEVVDVAINPKMPFFARVMYFLLFAVSSIFQLLNAGIGKVENDALTDEELSQSEEF